MNFKNFSARNQILAILSESDYDTYSSEKRSGLAYQVITVYGDNESQWFFDDWQGDIVQEKISDNLTDAETYYVEVWRKLSQNYIYVNIKPNYLAAFRNDGKERRCEECDEDLQQYFGLALLENHHAVTLENKAEFITISNHFGKTKFCRRKVT